MGLLEFLVVVVLIEAVSKCYRARLRSRTETQLTDQTGDLCAKLDKLEERMANIETIVLDAEKQRQFDSQL